MRGEKTDVFKVQRLELKDLVAFSNIKRVQSEIDKELGVLLDPNWFKRTQRGLKSKGDLNG